MPNPLIETLKKTTPEQLEIIFHNVFDTDNGKLVLEYLKLQCFYYGTTHIEGNIEYNEGMRAAILCIDRILNPIESDVSDSVNPEKAPDS